VAPIGGVGIELWTLQDGILFDNILITTDPAVAADAAAKVCAPPALGVK
jgi:calnexin